MKRPSALRLVPPILFAACSILLAPAEVRAQENSPQLAVKVGDRVETHGIVDSKGTVLEIGTGDKKNCYRVRSDGAAANDQGNWLCSHGVQGYIFLLGPGDKIIGDIYGPAANKPANAPAKPEPPVTAPAPAAHEAPSQPPAGIPPKRHPIAKPVQKKAKAGPPPMDLAKSMITFLWEDMSDEYGTINVDLHTVEIGKPRLWQETWSGRDMGTGIPGKTLVYPVHTTWTNRRYEHSQIVITENEGVHNFYINAFGVWQCGLGESKYTKPLQSISLP